MRKEKRSREGGREGGREGRREGGRTLSIMGEPVCQQYIELTEKSRAVMVPANSMGTYLPSPWISRSPSRFIVKSLTRVTSTTTSFKFTSENCTVGSVISSNEVMLLLKKDSTYTPDTCRVCESVWDIHSKNGYGFNSPLVWFSSCIFSEVSVMPSQCVPLIITKLLGRML